MKKKIIMTSVIIIIIAIIATTIIILVNKNRNNEQEGDNPTDENVVQESTDASNITETNILEGADRKINVVTNDEANKILPEMYLQAMERYSFNFDMEEDGRIKVLRYNEVMDDMFTSFGKEQFETFYSDYLIKDGDSVYLKDNTNIHEELDYEIVVENININGNTIECVVSTSFSKNGSAINTSEVFKIKKDTEKWRIDSFVRPY